MTAGTALVDLADYARRILDDLAYTAPEAEGLQRMKVAAWLNRCAVEARAEGRAEGKAEGFAEGFVEGVEAARSHLRKRACEFEADDMRATARFFRESADTLLALTQPRQAEATTFTLPPDLVDELGRLMKPETKSEVLDCIARWRALPDRDTFLNIIASYGGEPRNVVLRLLYALAPKAEATASEPDKFPPQPSSTAESPREPLRATGPRVAAIDEGSQGGVAPRHMDKEHGDALDLDELERLKEAARFKGYLNEDSASTLRDFSSALHRAAPELIRRARDRDMLREDFAREQEMRRDAQRRAELLEHPPAVSEYDDMRRRAEKAEREAYRLTADIDAMERRHAEALEAVRKRAVEAERERDEARAVFDEAGASLASAVNERDWLRVDVSKLTAERDDLAAAVREYLDDMNKYGAAVESILDRALAKLGAT